MRSEANIKKKKVGRLYEADNEILFDVLSDTKCSQQCLGWKLFREKQKRISKESVDSDLSFSKQNSAPCLNRRQQFQIRKVRFLKQVFSELAWRESTVV